MRLITLETDPSYGGGSEAMAMALSCELSQRGHEVFLLHEANGSMVRAYREFAARTFQLSLPGFSFRAPLLTYHCVVEIGRLARRQGIDVILSSHLGFIRAAALMRAFYGIPACFHLGLPNLGASASSRMAYRWIGAGIAPSHHTAETWRQAGWPSESLAVIPNWVDTDRFRPATDQAALRQELGIERDSHCIVYVGRICPEKGVETLIDAFPHVRSQVADASLVIVGSPPPEYRNRFNHLIATLDEDDRRRVILVPNSPVAENYFAAADVACVPSSWEEPFGLTLLEAMACATPVVATTVGIFPQIVGEEHRDFLVPPGDHIALAERLSCLLMQPEVRTTRGQRLRERVLQQFGKKQSVDRYERILLSLIAEAKSHVARLNFGSS
jgi:glycosyltransferase involved in cell wall biosynthesis